MRKDTVCGLKLIRTDRFVLTNGEKLNNEEALQRGITREDLIPDEKGEFLPQLAR